MKSLLYLLCILLACSHIHAQQDPKKGVKLVSWSGGECDKSIDPYRRINRIGKRSVKKQKLFMIVNFTDHCCITFSPSISFNDHVLRIEPYGQEGGDYCECDCCFSLALVIDNITDTAFTTLFKGKEIVYSQHPYPLKAITYKVVDGDTMNRTNRYGAKVGLWKEFYNDGKIRSLKHYAALAETIEPKSTWTKNYFDNGQLSYYDRKDSSEQWFMDGTLKKATYEHEEKNGDRITEVTEYYLNKQLKEKSRERHYAKGHGVKNAFTGNTALTIYEQLEKYYESGQPWILSRNDTTRWWYSDGKLHKWFYKDSAAEFYPDQAVKLRRKTWYVKRSNKSGYLEHVLEVTYHPNGTVATKYLSRDEEHTAGVYTGQRYKWVWDAQGQLISEPSNWKGPPP